MRGKVHVDNIVSVSSLLSDGTYTVCWPAYLNLTRRPQRMGLVWLACNKRHFLHYPRRPSKDCNLQKMKQRD